MSKTTIDALRISPKYTSDHWQALDQQRSADWPTAVDIVRDRIEGRFLRFANDWLKDEYSGFVVLAIDCLLVETVQQFIDGLPDGNEQSGRLFKKFLEGPRFQPAFNTKKARQDFYKDIRCGLLHQAEAKNQWLIRRQQATLLQKVGLGGYILDVKLFHKAIQDSLEDYFADIRKAERADLRANLWTKMNHICNVRVARGALLAAEANSGS
jgi:hypothetical protein